MYSYLTASFLIAVIGVCLNLSARNSRRKFVFWSAVLAAPTGLADVWFAPDYWTPDHIFGPHFSIEGMLFSFGNGAILATLVWPLFARVLSKTDLNDGLWAFWNRYVLATLPGFLVFLVLWDGLFGPLSVMQASFAGFVALAFWLGLRGQLSLTAGLAGATIFAAVYWVQTLLWSYFDPDLAQFWHANTSYLASDLPLSGLPGDELLWAAFYGLLWPHIIAITLGGEKPDPRVSRRRLS